MVYERAGSRIRTDDLLITNQLLYQLSYAGVPHTKAVLSGFIKRLVMTRFSRARTQRIQSHRAEIVTLQYQRLQQNRQER